jgi:hypothetical protein
MAKPHLTTLVRRTLTDAFVVDVRRGPNGSFTLAMAIDSPADIEPGRYALTPIKEHEGAIKRLVTVEQTSLLDRAALRKSGRHSLKRRP